MSTGYTHSVGDSFAALMWDMRELREHFFHKNAGVVLVETGPIPSGMGLATRNSQVEKEAK